jgi:tetratricopeptide (TPR) repeat protein
MKLRIANALVSYVSYIGKMIWPQNLAVIYPFPVVMLPVWQVLGSGLLLVCVSACFLCSLRRMPYLAMGWLWYLGTLVPVIGIVQGGMFPAMADRYVYVPLIGLFIIIAWSFFELAARWYHKKIWFVALITVLLSILVTITWKQAGYWKNSITLNEHTLAVTSNNYVSHNNLGVALEAKGHVDEAIHHYMEALRIKPNYVEVYYNLGIALEKQNRTDEAVVHYLEALRLKPDYFAALYNLGFVLTKAGRTDEAMGYYLEALRIKPDFVEAHFNLGNMMLIQNRTDEAIKRYSEALRLRPDYVDAHNNLGLALYRKGNVKGAIANYREALQINPDYIHAKRNLNKLLMSQ